jgi:hypothetical protein
MYLGISWQEMIDDFKELINSYFVTQYNWLTGNIPNLFKCYSML